MPYSGTERFAYYCTMDRRRLLDWLGDGSLSLDLRRVELNDADRMISQLGREFASPSDIILLWPDELAANEAIRLPVMVLSDAVIDDFIAWSSTFISTFTPITAFFRILSLSDLERFEPFNPPNRWIPAALLQKMAALTIAEALIQTGFRQNGIRGLNLQACELTFSFAALKALNQGFHPAQIFDVADAWDRIRALSPQRAIKLPAERSLSFWLIATEALLPQEAARNDIEWMRDLSQFIRSVAGGKPDIGVWRNFGTIKDALLNFESAASLPRERQIKFLDQSAKEIISTEAPLPLIEAMIGYLISRLGNGSFDYLNLASDYQDRFDGVCLWTAFFSIFEDSFDGLSTSYALGRHVAKGARSLEGIFHPVTASVGAREISIILEKNRSGLSNVGDQIIDIEILPCLTVPFPNPAKPSTESYERRERPAELGRAQSLLKEAVYLLERATAPDRSKAHGTVEPDLFPEKRGSGPTARKGSKSK